MRRHQKKCAEKVKNDEKTSLIQFMSQQMEEMKQEHAKERQKFRNQIENLLEKVGVI